MYQPESAYGINIGMWMQFGEILEMEAGEFPFRSVYDRLRDEFEKRRKTFEE